MAIVLFVASTADCYAQTQQIPRRHQQPSKPVVHCVEDFPVVPSWYHGHSKRPANVLPVVAAQPPVGGGQIAAVSRRQELMPRAKPAPNWPLPLQQPGAQQPSLHQQATATAAPDHAVLPHTVLLPRQTLPAAWWSSKVAQPLRSSPATIPVDLAGLMQAAVRHSNRVLAVQQSQWIRGQEYLAASAAFDPTLYTSTRFDGRNDPVGSDLTTGGPNRLEEDHWTMDTGVRGTTKSGASYSVGQQLGHLNSNSTFISPNDQGDARLGFSVKQPLLRDRAIDANRSLILTTRFNSDAAGWQYLEAIQEQLSKVATAYWSLYTERATLVQRAEHLRRAESIAQTLTARQSLDSVRSQVLRAEAAVAARRAALALAEANIRNVESELRALINAPDLNACFASELVPMQPATLSAIVFDPQAELAAALHRRPEVQLLKRQIEAGRVKLALAQNQTQPQLNLVFEGYVAALQGRSDVLGAWTEQFETQPGYAGGLEFATPYRNRAAHASIRQQQFALTQLQYLLQERQANVRSDVERSIRSLDATRQEVVSRSMALDAIRSELDYEEQRWRTLRGDVQFGQLQLDDLLSTQDRLFAEEQALLKAMVNFNRGLIEVQRSTGALVAIVDR